MLVAPDEIRSSLTGALKILAKNPGALSHFNLTSRGFWHSFQALWIAIPPFLLSLLAQRDWLMNEHNLTLEAFPSAAFFGIQLFGIAAD